MAKRKDGNAGWILAIIVVVVVAFTAIFHATSGFETTPVLNFSVIKNKNEWILANQIGLTFKKGEEIEVKQFDGNEQITVAIYAVKNEQTDLSFTYAGKTYAWNTAVAGQNVTDKFDVYVTQGTSKENGRIKINGSVGGVVERFCGTSDIKFNELPRYGDYFQMVITVGSASMTLGFSVQVEAESIILNRGEIVF